MRGSYSTPNNMPLKYTIPEHTLKFIYRSGRNSPRNFPLVVDDRVKEGLLVQSLLGNIRAGHLTNTPALPETTFEEVCDLLSKSSYRIKQKRENQVYGFRQCFHKLLEGDTNCLVNENGFPIYGVNFLKRYQITNIEAALKGAVLLGLHDSSEWRQLTMEHFGTVLNGNVDINIGHGHEFLISRKQLYKNGGSISNLENEAHKAWEIDRYRDLGVIVNEPNEEATVQYIRSSKGFGTCDDASLLTIGKIYGPDAFVMGFLMDATDTYEKHIINPVEGGIDEQYAREIQSKWKEKHGKDLLTPEEIMRVIYLGAKSNSFFLPFSSSHRRLVERPQRKKKRPSRNEPKKLRNFLIKEAQNGPELSSQSTVENHIRFLKQGFRFPCNLGFDRFPSIKFYEVMEKRWEMYEKRFQTHCF